MTVKEIMEAAGLYKEGTREELKGQFIEEDTVEIGGKTYTVSRISYLDSWLFTNELDSILARQNPIIHDVYARAAVNIFDLIRMVNMNTKQGFKGAAASGNELDLMLFAARQFYDPDSTGNARSSWVKAVSSASSKYFMEGSGGSEELTMAEEEGQIWLGFYNPASQPCVDAVKITMNTEPFNVQTLDFEQVQDEVGDVIIELKEPWTLPPEQSGQVEAYYFRTGTDEMRPLGVWVYMAKNMRALGDLIP